jgi:hypothetical protein
MISVRLLHPDRDFDRSQAPPWNAAALRTDLGLDTLFGAMAKGDDFVLDVATTVVLAGVRSDALTVRFRQDALADALRAPQVIRAIYDLTIETQELARKEHLFSFERDPAWVLRHGRVLMEILLQQLWKLRRIADREGEQFEAEAWRRFFRMVREELDDAYLAEVRRRVAELDFTGGVLLSARLAPGGKGEDYRLHFAPWKPPTWWARLRTWLFGRRLPPFSFALHPMDESGHRALENLTNRGIAQVANSAAAAAEQVRAFFDTLRWETAFYLGAAQLHAALAARGARVCRPDLSGAGPRLQAAGLYDPGLRLQTSAEVVANDVAADGKPLVLVTGANQGGKTTFLRSLGLAQLMMQAGLFVAADRFAGSLCDGLFTHFKRREDAAMESGKLDEELVRLSDIVDHLGRNALVLFNEPFAATNEREGSEIGWQVIGALLDRQVRVACVTHHFGLGQRLWRERRAQGVFLRAERRADGARTYRLAAAEPLATSYGADLYQQVFEAAPRRAQSAAAARRAI